MTHPVPCPESSPTPSHMHMPNVKIVIYVPSMTIFFKTKAFCFINQNPLDNLQYQLVFTKFHVFLWVANFQGLTAGFACLPTLSRTFVAGYICLTKNIGFFTRGGIYPFLLYPTHVFFISFFFHATVRLILDFVPFYQAHHQTPNTVSISTMYSRHAIEHQT